MRITSKKNNGLQVILIGLMVSDWLGQQLKTARQKLNRMEFSVMGPHGIIYKYTNNIYNRANIYTNEMMSWGRNG